MKIGILTDTVTSWIIPYIEDLKKQLSEHEIYHVFSVEDVQEGDVLFALSCEKIISRKILDKNEHTIVVHPSELPKGRGWSPTAWQILEGKNRIPISLFEAEESVDSGVVYILDYINLDGTELNEEIKHLQGLKTIEMCVSFIQQYNTIQGSPQEGKPTFYAKRTAESSELDISKSIEEQFNLLRVVDNKRYPAYFHINGQRYTVIITKD